MKLTNLIWVLALAGAVAACNSGSPITGTPPPPPPTGGSNGGGGTGGSGGGSLEGNCINDADAAVYAQLDFVNGKGEASSGTDASSAIGSECVRGSTVSMPPVEGCGDETFAVIACLGNCPQETIDALADCVVACTGDTIAGITGGDTLSDDCLACTGETVACGAAFCTPPCVTSTTAPECIQCRCDQGCTPQFVICSGIPSS
ncbi:MAG: hypothetical protein JRG67_04000, partial [Deltaproteobacteria bacterium]|nr:hypothetical protein [Deltaproteobacteria bacterium]